MKLNKILYKLLLKIKLIFLKKKLHALLMLMKDVIINFHLYQ